MSGSGNNTADHALLARLNALRKSTIDLDAQKPLLASNPRISSGIDPAPGRTLHNDLLVRFDTLTGRSRDKSMGGNRSAAERRGLSGDGDDAKTVEDIIADLPAEEIWHIGKDDEENIQELMKHAKSALEAEQMTDISNNKDIDDSVPATGKEHARVLQDENPHEFEPAEEEEVVDREADEYLAQILEEIESSNTDATVNERDTGEKPTNDSPSHDRVIQSAINDLAPVPSTEPDPPSYSDITADDALASRFANLGLPSVPNTIKSATVQAKAKQQQIQRDRDEDIDSWCCICNDDASLSCKGCDGDLYCTNCWLEGHKGPDAGFDERKHKAVQYNMGGGLKNQPTRASMAR